MEERVTGKRRLKLHSPLQLLVNQVASDLLDPLIFSDFVRAKTVPFKTVAHFMDGDGMSRIGHSLVLLPIAAPSDRDPNMCFHLVGSDGTRSSFYL